MGVAALCVVTSSFALTLGRAKATVNVGQPLKLVVSVQMDAEEAISAQCFAADIFYGDTRQDASRIGVTSELNTQLQSTNVVVSLSSPVNEPVVTVYLQAGCERKISRKYVLLSEFAATPAPSTQPANSLGASLLSRRAASTGALGTVAKDAYPLPAVGKRKKSDPLATPSRDVPVNLSVPKGLKTTARRAHLKLSPLDLTQEIEPALRLSSDLVTEVSEDLQKRAQAAAFWSALNVTHQEVSSAESVRQAMEVDLKNLQGITAKNHALLQDLAVRMDKAESGRHSNPLVYALILAIIAMGVTTAFLWSRMRHRGLSSEPWWREDIAGDMSETVGVAGSEGPKSPPVGNEMGQSETVLRSVTPSDVLDPPSQKLADTDIALEMEDPEDIGRSTHPRHKASRSPVRAKPSPNLSRSAGHVDFGHSMSAAILRSVNTKEMLDVLQQAEFFMALGQHDEAIALLRDSVDDEVDANPLVQLELLKVLHTLGLKAEYDHYRQRFNGIFSGHVPNYAHFNQVGSGLEAYPAVCQQIVALWPSPAAVTHIENCLVRTRFESDRQDFDLEAFRDLLMLHGVASRIASVASGSSFVAFSATKPAPIPVSAAPEREIDFDLSQSHDGNLIDFDASGWSPSLPGAVEGKPS